MTLKVNEVFRSIQGEGLAIGRPAIFVRLQGCNLACSFCDTKYALGEKANSYPCYKVLSQEITQKGPNTDMVVLTGGEPLLQQRELTRLNRLLKSRGYEIHVETNGSLLPGAGMMEAVDYWTISPKLTYDLDKAYSQKRSYRYSLQKFSQLPNASFKFVVAQESDLPDIYKLMVELNPKIQIIIQPERFRFAEEMLTNDRSLDHVPRRIAYLTRMKDLITWCQTHLDGLNWRILPQLHYLLWEGKKGV